MGVRVSAWALVVIVTVLAGCSASSIGGSTTKPLRVTGRVRVDGQPAAMLVVSFYPEVDSGLTDFVAASTNDQGMFTVPSFKKGNGLTAGNYFLTFKWETMGLKKDRLNGAYQEAFLDPKKSTYKVTIVSDKPNDLGVIDLSTKAKDN